MYNAMNYQEMCRLMISGFLSSSSSLHLGDIARSHGLDYHFYADDCQLYLSFKTPSSEYIVFCKSKIEACVSDVKSWKVISKLKMNSDKTQILIFSGLLLSSSYPSWIPAMQAERMGVAHLSSVLRETLELFLMIPCLGCPMLQMYASPPFFIDVIFVKSVRSCRVIKPKSALQYSRLDCLQGGLL